MSIFDSLERKTPVGIIHGTDWWTDCDDIVALRVLARAHKKDLIDLKAVCADAVMDDTAASIDAMLKSEGLDIPIGIDRDIKLDPSRCCYQKFLAKYPHSAENAGCEDACRLYRKMLASSDEKVIITEVGFPQVLGRLLESQPDDISELDGYSLVKEKVSSFMMMAGRWDIPDGKEYNFINVPEGRKAAALICEKCPVPVVFLGWEVGCDVITGSKLPEGDILKEAMKVHGSANGRSSWDPMLALLAVLGDFETAGYEAVYGKASADPETGANNFTKDDNGKDCYVVKKYENSFYSDMIDEIIA